MNAFKYAGCLTISASLLMAGCQKSTSTGPVTTAPRTDAPRTTAPRTDAPAQKKLTVMAAKSQTIKRGDTDEVMVTINRDNFDDAVTIRLNDLPKGVESLNAEAVIPAGSNSATFKLKAGADAALGEHSITIDAKAPGLGANTQMFKLTVQES